MTTQGFILIDEDGVALNNSGTVSNAGNLNSVATKKLTKDGKAYTYVSGQAWRYWWRETLQKHFGWKLSPITKLEKKNVLYTEANPVTYDDDDIFGYMKAATDVDTDETGEAKKSKSGKEKKKDITVTRVSPLKNSVLVSVGSVKVERNFSSASRQNDVPVLYGKEEYSAIMKGMFSIDLEQVGTFSNYLRTGFKNISESVESLLSKEDGVEKIDDKFIVDKNGKPEKLYRLGKAKRLKRVVDTISALKFISGGAMQTSNMGDVTPKFIVLATATSGNHPFSHIVKADPFNKEQTILNIEGLKEVLNDYKDQFKGNIFIGKRSGFMDEYSGVLKALETEFDNVQILSINQAIDQYCEQVKTQLI
ncbi:type I-B CRISPR-associated protein Cas7/Cst2/DevR [Arachidicoccus soli]|uniref:Type I-B CRISPR-associated protein Cas7/Cst2/DevR n=1 Tax=Arachidicoccus soli TaxID=2341117 RepID=A0A386HR26_9BACT|nr:type I-B CRISPR-associated protein Cas7/Cst2/DevR [Arachidicoccus soli]AYD48407.1 type I-B CRISPR-associated protein Cas7/Cst2/DevR [Arachidicoccus soli]